MNPFLSEMNTQTLRQGVPLTVLIVPLKSQNFRENGCPEIPVYFHYAFDRRKSATFDK